MDGDGGGTDAGGMGAMDSGGAAEMGSTNEESPDSGSSVLQSMGYLDSGTEMNSADGSAGSEMSVFESVVIAAVVLLVGIGFLYFLLAGILAIFGVQL